MIVVQPPSTWELYLIYIFSPIYDKLLSFNALIGGFLSDRSRGLFCWPYLIENVNVSRDQFVIRIFFAGQQKVINEQEEEVGVGKTDRSEILIWEINGL